MKYTCDCCGYRTLEDPPNSYEICPVCFWESDLVQSSNEDFAVGANKISLKEARDNFKKYGACDSKYIRFVRPPFENEKM